MSKLPCFLSREARQDLQHIWDYMAEQNPIRADQWLDEFETRCQLLSEMPLIGRQRDELQPGLRSFLLGRYILFYRLQEEQIEIVRVLSGYQDLESLF